MKSSFIALKTQETEQDFHLVIEPIMVKKFAQVGVEITKTTTFKNLNEMNKNLFVLLEAVSVVFVDLKIQNIDMIINQIDKFYAVSKVEFSKGYYWQDKTNNRICVLFDINDAQFYKNLEKDFLRNLFSNTKYLNIIKTYGLDESEVRRAMNSINNPENFEYYTSSEFLDCEIDILAEGDYYNSEALNSYIRQAYELLNNYVYSDSEQNMFEKLSELLSVRNIRLSFCDILTNGQFEYVLKKNMKDYNQNINSCYSIFDKRELVQKLNMKQELLYSDKIDELIYESAVAVLDKDKCEVVVVVGGTSEKALVAIGDNESIHLYKFNFNHSKNFVYNIIIQTTIFKLLKKLKKNTGLF